MKVLPFLLFLAVSAQPQTLPFKVTGFVDGYLRVEQATIRRRTRTSFRYRHDGKARE
jgi:hypothetical protein